MSVDKKLDLDNLTFVDEAVVPTKRVRYTPYRDIVTRIQKGKALVISDKEVNVDTFRAGIVRLQKKGEFKQLALRQSKDAEGTRILYILNPSIPLPTEIKRKAKHAPITTS